MGDELNEDGALCRLMDMIHTCSIASLQLPY